MIALQAQLFQNCEWFVLLSISPVKCTKPVNIRMNNLKRRTLSLTWDAPKDMGEYTKLLHYKIVYAADGTIHSNKVKIM